MGDHQKLFEQSELNNNTDPELVKCCKMEEDRCVERLSQAMES